MEKLYVARFQSDLLKRSPLCGFQECRDDGLGALLLCKPFLTFMRWQI